MTCGGRVPACFSGCSVHPEYMPARKAIRVHSGPTAQAEVSARLKESIDWGEWSSALFAPSV